MPSLLFTSDCTGEPSPERALEEPLISALENGLDFLGLRLLTPLRPIVFSLFLKSLNYRIDPYFALVHRTFEPTEQFHNKHLMCLLHNRMLIGENTKRLTVWKINLLSTHNFLLLHVHHFLLGHLP